jgi:hypothetical protein
MPIIAIEYAASIDLDTDRADEIKEYTSMSVATAFNCRDANDLLINLKPEDVTVFLDTYSKSARNAPRVMANITAITYPDRMMNMRERLNAIKATLANHFRWYSSCVDLRDDEVSLYFRGVAENHWV